MTCPQFDPLTVKLCAYALWKNAVWEFLHTHDFHTTPRIFVSRDELDNDYPDKVQDLALRYMTFLGHLTPSKGLPDDVVCSLIRDGLKAVEKGLLESDLKLRRENGTWRVPPDLAPKTLTQHLKEG